MDPHTPSRTSQAVATVRADFDRPASPGGDAGAQRRLCLGMVRSTSTWLRPHLEARTRFFDRQVLEALAAGVGQVVILGAGYDDRALRFRTPGARFFELDHPATQADKRRRLLAIDPDLDGVTLASVDLGADDVGRVLAGAGHDAGADTLFVAEGLLVYLDRATNHRVLAALAARATPDSVLAASLAVHDSGLADDEVAERANARRPGGRVEAWHTILTRPDYDDLLEHAGWLVTDRVEAESATPPRVRRASGTGGSSLVVARVGSRRKLDAVEEPA